MGEVSLSKEYRRTVAGILPKAWSISFVGREFEVKLGKMLDSEKNIGVPKFYVGNKSVQWFKIDTNELSTMRMSRDDLLRFQLRRGDLLVCEGGQVGRAAIWDASLDECYYQKALHRLRPINGFDSYLMLCYLYLWSSSGFFNNYITQTSIAHLPREKFVEIPLPLPPPLEQRAIATALSDVDALIAGLDQLITKKRDIK